MAIGIVDLDLIEDPTHYILNLDIMQISGYYKKRNEKVVLCRTLDIKELEWFSTLYLVYNGEKPLPLDNFVTNPKVVLVGKYFYGNYLSLPEEIYDTYPDRTVYDRLIEYGALSNRRRAILKRLYISADFLRLRRASNHKFISENSDRLLFFDQDITEADMEVITSFNKKYCFYYPVTVKRLKDAEEWLKRDNFIILGTTRPFNGYFIESDLNKLLEGDYNVTSLYTLFFGYCNPNYYFSEAKKMLKFIYAAKSKRMNFKIKVARISDYNFSFLFDILKRWYENPNILTEKNIFKTYFKTVQNFKFGQKIKAVDPELYVLLKTDYIMRCNNELAKKDYWGMD